MLRSDFVMKLMSVVLFIAIAVYIGLYLYNTANKPLQTALAEKYTAEDSFGTDGYIARSETPLSELGGAQTVIVSEGEKVAKGQPVAVFYAGTDALEKASQIRALQLGIQEAEAELNLGRESGPGDAEASVLSLSDAVQHEDLRSLDILTLSVRNHVFTQGKSAVSSTELSSLKAQLGDLVAGNTGANTLYAPVSGLFSASVDGYEGIAADQLTNLTPSSLRALFAPEHAGGTTDGTAAGKPVGKMITGIQWYYAAVMDARDAARLKDTKTAVVRFTGAYNGTVSMAVESLGAEENGQAVVVFSAKSSLSDLTAVRALSAQVVLDRITGLTIPKAAVRTDGDKPYIYLLTGLQAEKVPVDEIKDLGDTVIVQDGASNGTVIRPGAEVIVKGRDLYDGKVVDR
jgi:hypothetical protein